MDFGPLFNPALLLESAPVARQPEAPLPVPRPADRATHTERKEALRKTVAGLVSHVSTTFGVDHKLAHATLNARCGGPVATATADELERRRALIMQWLVRRSYDGFR